MDDPIYQQTVADEGFDPEKDLREPWTLRAATKRIQDAKKSSPPAGVSHVNAQRTVAEGLALVDGPTSPSWT